ncbi:MAG: peptidylprolyl isomerase [Planctomycetaceae bacterium]
MTHRLSFSCVVLALLAGCEPAREGTNAPLPEEVASPTEPEAGNRDPEAPATYQVLLDTTEGEVVIDVDRSLAPRGADRLYRLVNEGFYDGAKFFRVVDGFVVQFGMAADPAVHAKWGEANFRDDPVKGSNTKGTITFATSGPNSRSTQIFINLADNEWLDDAGFAPFGKVTKGMDVVEAFHSGYGEGPPQGTGPDQGRIAAEGNAYLDAEFPELDGIKTARILSENGEPVEATADAATADAAKADEAAPEATSENE